MSRPATPQVGSLPCPPPPPRARGSGALGNTLPPTHPYSPACALTTHTATAHPQHTGMAASSSRVCHRGVQDRAPFHHLAQLRWGVPPLQRLGQIFFRAFGQSKFFSCTN